VAYPVAHLYFTVQRGWSRVATGALLGLFCGFLWDALQGGIIEYATYNVGLPGAPHAGRDDHGSRRTLA